ADNYSLQMTANKNIAMGGSAQSFFGGVERIPELSLTNYRFTQGFLSHVPANFMLSVGRYLEGGLTGGTGGASTVETERAVAGFTLNNTRYALSPKTDLNAGGGFEQYFYGPGYAQYIVRNNTTLTQRWGKRSGVNLNYTYQRPEGGTPFRFDVLGNYHTMNMDVGQLDDRRFQITARTGYDFAQQSFGGLPKRPWQSVSLNYIDNPFGFRKDRQIFFQLKIKGLPIFNRIGTGQFGQALDTGVGEVF